MDEILMAADELMERLRKFDGVYQIRTDFSPGKNEMRLSLRPEARALGLTVEDLARFIHKDIARNLMYARIWGEGYYPGQKVPRDHPLQDMDVVELKS